MGDWELTRAITHADDVRETYRGTHGKNVDYPAWWYLSGYLWGLQDRVPQLAKNLTEEEWECTKIGLADGKGDREMYLAEPPPFTTETIYL